MGRRPVERSKERAAKEFGQRLRILREYEVITTQEDLAYRSGLHRQYVGIIERGQANPALYTIIRLALGLNVDAGELVSGLLGSRQKLWVVCDHCQRMSWR